MSRHIKAMSSQRHNVHVVRVRVGFFLSLLWLGSFRRLCPANDVVRAVSTTFRIHKKRAHVSHVAPRGALCGKTRPESTPNSVFPKFEYADVSETCQMCVARALVSALGHGEGPLRPELESQFGPSDPTDPTILAPSPRIPRF